MELSGRMKGKCLFFSIGIAVIIAGCSNPPVADSPQPPVVTEKVPVINVPSFNADSAYAYVKKQVDFGPRVPGTKAHTACADWLVQKFKSFQLEVMVQSGMVTTFDQKKFNLKNIIASYRPQQADRILLCAHWDSRPFADSDTANTNKPIDGADDGASGVGTLLEIARQLSSNSCDMGVDIILFDVEDYGKNSEEDSWCLGSQYWGKNLHKPLYSARYGILLDMTGAKGASFSYEQTSMYYASAVVEKVWTTAARLGYSDYFLAQNGGGTTDDHYYVNTLANIPTIDIINTDRNTGRFGFYHHTHADNMDIIDRNTLKAVGQTVLTVVYTEK